MTKDNKLVKIDNPKWLNGDKEISLVKETEEPDALMEHVPKLNPIPILEHQITYTEEVKDLLYRLLQFRTHSKSSMQDTFIEKLKERFETRGGVTELDSYGNLYVTKGNAEFYPCAMAHTDINQKKVNDFKVMEYYPWVFGFDCDTAKQCGLGADDKVGVLFCCLMFDKFDNIKLFFPKDEEVGIIGTSKANRDFFTNCSMLVQLDRRSYSNDLINYTNGVDVFGEEFEDGVSHLLKKYNYKVAKGICTDVGAVKQFDNVKCVGMNVSCGYINEHSSDEVISIPHMVNALNFGYEIMKLGVDRVWEHKSTYLSYGNYEGYGDYKGYGRYGSYGGYSYSEIDDYDWDIPSYRYANENAKPEGNAANSDYLIDAFQLAYESGNDWYLNDERTYDDPYRYVMDEHEFGCDVGYIDRSIYINKKYLELDDLYLEMHSMYIRQVNRAHTLKQEYVTPNGTEVKTLYADDQYELDTYLASGHCPNCHTQQIEITNSLLLDTECVYCNSKFNIPS